MKSLGKAHVLLVEDDPTQALLVRELLEEATGVTGLVTHVTRLGDAIAALAQRSFDVALLDLGLPDSAGLASLIALRRAAPELPVVVVTGLDDEELGLAALKAGAQDYLVKGRVEPLLLARSLRYAIERSRAELALARERQMLRAVVNTIPDLVWLKDAAGVYVNANPMFERFMGRSEAELVGRTDKDLVEPELAEAFRANDRLAIEAGGPRVNEEWVTFADDGHRALLETIKTPVYDAGRLLGVLGIAREVTERFRATEALRESKARLEAALEGGGIGTWSYDLATGQSWWDESAEGLFGRGIEHADRGWVRGFLEFVHPDDERRLATAAERCIRDRTPFFEEFRYLRPDGSEVCFVGRGRLVETHDGAPPRMMGAVVDITERRRSQEALRASEERFRELAESIHEVFWMTSVDKTQVMYVSPAYEAIWGRPARALYDDPASWASAIHPEDRERVWRAAATEQAAGSYDEEYRIVRPDGEVRWIRDQAFPVRDSHGTVIRIVGVAEDFTARRRLEHQMHESQKMESIGVLAGGVAHDFNNLLTVISGNTELLRMELDEGCEAAHLAQQVGEAAARAAALTRQLLAFSRRDVLEPKLLDVNQVVRDLQRMLGRLLGEDVLMSVDLGAGLGHVFADPGHLEQVVMNLAVNARDAMPRGGRLEIETRAVGATEGAGPGAAEGGAARFVRLRVRDSGHGMPPEVQARIFEPFFTTKGRGRGTGLGLAVVHGIVAQSGGRIEVESQLGGGTTFTIYLPESGRAAAEKDRAAERARGRGSGTVLIVEDDPSVRSVAARMLRREGYQVVLAATGEEALAMVGKAGQPPDLVITDVVMPGMDGGELAARLRAVAPGVRVLFTSGFTDDAVVRHGILRNEVPFLQKPYSVTSLATKVREVLAST